MNKKKNFGGVALIIITLITGFAILALTGLFDMSTPEEMNYKEFLTMVRDEHIVAVQVRDDVIYAITDESEYTVEDFFKRSKYDIYSIMPSDDAFTADMTAIAASITGKNPSEITYADYPFEYKKLQTEGASVWSYILPLILSMAAIFLFYYFLIIRPQTGGKQMQNFTRSRARATMGNENKVTFNDVEGADEEKQELAEIVDFLRSPRRFTDMGARIPKGVLLVGPPGTGKTLLAKAVAGEANVPFFSISGSDFVEMYVGVGASRVRDMFSTAKKCAPAIIFIDEIDAVGRQRGAGLGGGHDEREQTLNQLLVEMDGFALNEGIIIIAATNRPDILDPALLRPGRFDRQITVHIPDLKGREAILRVHARNKPIADDVDFNVIARSTPGFTGADLANVLNEAAILTARYDKKKITMEEIEEAIARVMIGPEKRSRIISEEDRRCTAYHEGGHAILALRLEKCDPVHEISIIPRGMAAGYTMSLPKQDHDHITKNKLLDSICQLLGGRVAEEIVLGDVSTGAYNDLQRASKIAKSMVVEYGMSSSIGPVYLGGQMEVFLGKELGHSRDYSDELAAKIDAEVRAIIDEQYEKAKRILTSDRALLDKLTDILLEYEVITGAEFVKIANGEEPELIPYRQKTEQRDKARAAASEKYKNRRRVDDQNPLRNVNDPFGYQDNDNNTSNDNDGDMSNKE